MTKLFTLVFASLSAAGALSACSSAPKQATPAAAPEADATRAQIGDLRNQVLSLSSHLESLETKLAAVNEKLEKERVVSENAMNVKPPRAGSATAHPSDTEGLDIVPTHAKTDPESGFETDEPIQNFRKAMIFFETGKLPESILSFSSFVEKFPDHALAGSAQFYVGESYYREKEYRLALQEFERVLTTYDRSAHVSDTLQHMAEIEAHLKMPEASARHRHLLTSLFPESPAAADIKAQGAISESAPSGGGAAATAPDNSAGTANSTGGAIKLDEPPATAPVPSNLSAPTPSSSGVPMSSGASVPPAAQVGKREE